jgi:hypothetical protein
MTCKLRLFVAICGVFVVFMPLTARAANLDYTVDVDSAVVVTGSPRLTLTIGAATQYAVYNAGASTPTSLVFRYAVQAGDFDANGIEVGASIDLNGGTILDAGGNALTLTYAAPVTPNVKVQTYQAAFTTDPITESNETAAAFQITKAPIGADFDYTITSSGGAGSVTGSGTISADPQAVTGINVSNLPYGTLTISVTVTNASGTGEARTDDVTGNAPGVIDSYTAEAAYSVRRLRTAYTGSAIQVRRTSDSTTSDIGFTFAGNLNTSALLTFCAATSCHVATWYDQSGNVRNATQGTPANQPRIVNAGTLETQGGRPALYYNGTASSMSAASVTQNLLGNTPTFMAVVSPSAIASYVGILIWRASGAVNGIDMSNSSTWTYIWNGTVSTYGWVGGPAITTGALQTISVAITPAAGLYRKNGATATNTTAHAVTNGAAALVFGSDPCCGGRLLTGFFPEAILFSTLSEPNRTIVEDNQRTYYGTP